MLAFLSAVVVLPLHDMSSSFCHKTLCPGVSGGIRRLVEGLLNKEIWPGGKQKEMMLGCTTYHLEKMGEAIAAGDFDIDA